MSNKLKASLLFALAWAVSMACLAVMAWLFDRPAAYANPWVFFGSMGCLISAACTAVPAIVFGVELFDRADRPAA